MSEEWTRFPYGGAKEEEYILDYKGNKVRKGDRVVLINQHDGWAKEDHVYPGMVYIVTTITARSVIVSGHDAFGVYFIEAQSFEKYTNDWDL